MRDTALKYVTTLDGDSRRALEAFAKLYCTSPIVLYVGAGISTADGAFGLPGWTSLLREMFLKAPGRGVRSSLSKNPWRAADEVARAWGGAGALQKQLRRRIAAATNFTRAHNQLSAEFVSAAPTLNAVTAFCAELEGLTERDGRRTCRVRRNPRIAAILSTNYDPYLEGASSSKFIRPLLKPVAAYGSSAGKLHQIPVFHLHGYYPLRRSSRRGGRRALTPELVLRASEYRKAWNDRSAFTPTLVPQVHYLRHYPALFIGFSFADRYVRRLLEVVRRERRTDGAPRHFTFIARDDFRDRGEMFKRLGVSPIVYRDHRCVPELLGYVYSSGLRRDRGQQGPELWTGASERRRGDGRVSPSECWQILLASRTLRYSLDDS